MDLDGVAIVVLGTFIALVRILSLASASAAGGFRGEQPRRWARRGLLQVPHA